MAPERGDAGTWQRFKYHVWFHWKYERGFSVVMLALLTGLLLSLPIAIAFAATLLLPGLLAFAVILSPVIAWRWWQSRKAG